MAETEHEAEYYRAVADTAGSTAMSLRHVLIFIRLATLSLVRDYLLSRFLLDFFSMGATYTATGSSFLGDCNGMRETALYDLMRNTPSKNFHQQVKIQRENSQYIN
jgi:hypothetical protein